MMRRVSQWPARCLGRLGEASLPLRVTLGQSVPLQASASPPEAMAWSVSVMTPPGTPVTVPPEVGGAALQCPGQRRADRRVRSGLAEPWAFTFRRGSEAELAFAAGPEPAWGVCGVG